MKNLTSFALAILGLFLLFSCKKDKSGNSSGSTADSVAVLGKWTIFRDASYFYASSNGAFLDSMAIPTGQGYFNFETGGILTFYDVNWTPPTDTEAYEILQNKYMVIDFMDTLNLKLSTDTVLLTQLTYNTTNFSSNVSATEADTVVLVK